MVLFTSEFESKSLASLPFTLSSEIVLCKQFDEAFASKLLSSFPFYALSVISIPKFAHPICMYLYNGLLALNQLSAVTL